MSTIKSFSVGEGDMFYINHGSDSFTIIDCCYKDNEQRDFIFDQINKLSANKGITRFISTHPDEDHIHGLDVFDDKIGIVNFYVVKNEAVKSDETDGFKRYCALRDGNYAYYVQKGCTRKWLNEGDSQRGGAGISFLWPILSDQCFKEALKKVKDETGFNNISPIFTYSLDKGIKAIWMGDMETSFLERIKDKVCWPKVDVLFAPHHGRKSGHVSSDVLEKLNPKVIVIGEAPSKDLDYYSGYETIKQNSAGNITFICQSGKTDVYVENTNYNYKVASFFDDGLKNTNDGKYIGSFTPYAAECE